MEYIQEYNIFKKILKKAKDKVQSYFKITENDFDTVYDLFLSEFEGMLKEYKKYPNNDPDSSIRQTVNHAHFLCDIEKESEDYYYITHSDDTIIISILLYYDKYENVCAWKFPDLMKKRMEIDKKILIFRKRLRKFKFLTSIGNKVKGKNLDDLHPEEITLFINKIINI